MAMQRSGEHGVKGDGQHAGDRSNENNGPHRFTPVQLVAE
jgi:hypothetical protein